MQGLRQHEAGGTLVRADDTPSAAHQVAIGGLVVFQLQQIAIYLAGFPPPGFIWWADLVDET
jgi:hypothetical protein